MESLSKNATLYTPPEGVNINGVVQIVHGMVEHQGRYKELADFLSENGLVVITSDLRGHGKNVRREEDLGYFGDNAVTHILADIHDITAYARANYPNKPYFLVGHSMGSLIATNYVKKYDNFLDGLFLSGIPGPNGMVGVGKMLIRVMASFKGEFHRSQFIENMVLGGYSKPFADESSKFAWLANDKSVVLKYEADPECGFTFTLNGFYTLMEFMEGAYTDGSWITKNKNLPIKLMSGSDDPCMGNKKSFLKAVEMFRNAGYKNVSHVLYDGQRHEIFQDTEKAKAREDLLADINKIIFGDDEKEIELTLDLIKSNK